MAALIGALFALRVPCGAATPTLTTLYSFPSGTNGAFPEAGLVLHNTVLFGTTYAGGSGWGTVFSLTPGTGGIWTEKVLYSFTGQSGDGANPRAGVVFSSRGVIFGTTEYGGAGYGTVFSLTPVTGGNWTKNVIYSFTGAPSGCGTAPPCDGANPEAGLIQNPKNGVLYGTTNAGGTSGYGTVFQLIPPTPPSTTWTEKVLYSFAGAPDGANPVAPLTLSSNGLLYGTTYGGGAGVCSGGPPPVCPSWGTVFQLTPPVPPSTTWTETVLYNFNGAPSGAGGGTACSATTQPPCDGGAPAGNLVLNATTGALFGTTTLGGDPTGCPEGGYEQGCGTVFALTPGGGGTWTESLLYTFGPPRNAMVPFNLFSPPGGGGPLYGTAFAGGSVSACFPASYLGCGMVYLLKPPVSPSITWTFNTLAVFNGDNGGGPNGVILSPKGGLLYGTTYAGGASGGYGTVFQVTF